MTHSTFDIRLSAPGVGVPVYASSWPPTKPRKSWRMFEQIARRVADGETVTFRPTGSSMVPLIQSRDEVVVLPVDPTRVEGGDIVLTKVAGNVYIHLVKAIEPAKRRVQIGSRSRRHQRMDQLRPGVRHRRLGGRSRAAGNENQGHSARHGKVRGAASIWLTSPLVR